MASSEVCLFTRNTYIHVKMFVAFNDIVTKRQYPVYGHKNTAGKRYHIIAFTK